MEIILNNSQIIKILREQKIKPSRIDPLGSEDYIEKKPEQKKQIIDLKKEFNFDKIPDGKNNYRSGQMSLDALKEAIKKYNIKNVIRLNGDGSDGKYSSKHPEVKVSAEEKVCRENNCSFNIINSHLGYKYGQGYITSLDKVDDILKQGNTLIHCAHGADRTGGMVGGYLKKNNIITDLDELWKYTTKYNDWESMLRRGSFFGTGYDRYADTFYPINLLKKRNKNKVDKKSHNLRDDGKWNPCKTCMKNYVGNLDHCGFQAIERFEENYGSGDYGRPEPPNYFERNHKTFDNRIVNRIKNTIGSAAWDSMPPKFKMQLWSFMYNADSGKSDSRKWLSVLYLTADDQISEFDSKLSKNIRRDTNSKEFKNALNLIKSTKDWGSRYNKLVKMLDGHYKTLESWRPLAYKNTWSFRPKALDDMYNECSSSK